MEVLGMKRYPRGELCLVGMPFGALVDFDGCMHDFFMLRQPAAYRFGSQFLVMCHETDGARIA